MFDFIKKQVHRNPRIAAVYFIFLSLFLIISLKIFYLQVFRADFFQRLAKNQHYRIMPLEGKRGTIFDRRKRILATGVNCYSVFADPLRVENMQLIANTLSLDLGISKRALLSKLKKKKRFVWIKRKISLEDKKKLESSSLQGVGFIREEKRFYPQDELGSCVIGITDIDNKGLEGLELFYNDYLNGKDGLVRIQQDSASRQIILSSQVISPQAGADIILTIDGQIQYWVHEYLKKAVVDFRAKSGSIVVMRANSGEVLALANYPSFNPNKRDSISLDQVRNRAISDMFEPGSVFKIVALCAAIGEKKFPKDNKIFCENGKFKIPGTILHDWKPYGELTYKQVFMKSSNIGVAKITQSVGPAAYFRYLKLLGFGKLTGIDLPAETRGSLKPLRQWSRTSQYIIPIGQEVGVNLMQLVCAFGVVANGGYLVRPYVVKDICSNNFCKTIHPKKKRVLPANVANEAKSVLIEVVEQGTGKRAGLKGRKIGGKTGTAQKFDPKIGKYSPTKYRATFVGFIADMDEPLVIGITIDEPKKSHFGGVVAAPVFSRIASKIVNYIETE